MTFAQCGECEKPIDVRLGLGHSNFLPPRQGEATKLFFCDGKCQDAFEADEMLFAEDKKRKGGYVRYYQ